MTKRHCLEPRGLSQNDGLFPLNLVVVGGTPTLGNMGEPILVALNRQFGIENRAIQNRAIRIVRFQGHSVAVLNLERLLFGMAILNRVSTILLHCVIQLIFVSRCGFSGHSRPAIPPFVALRATGWAGSFVARTKVHTPASQNSEAHNYDPNGNNYQNHPLDRRLREKKSTLANPFLSCKQTFLVLSQTFLDTYDQNF